MNVSSSGPLSNLSPSPAQTLRHARDTSACPYSTASDWIIEAIQLLESKNHTTQRVISYRQMALKTKHVVAREEGRRLESGHVREAP